MASFFSRAVRLHPTHPLSYATALRFFDYFAKYESLKDEELKNNIRRKIIDKEYSKERFDCKRS